MGKSPCCIKVGLKKGPWSPVEDQKLLAYIEKHGLGSWRSLPSKAGLQRCGKSCRLRWRNYLRPDIKRGKFSLQEEQSIIQLHALLGNRWSVIANQLPRRTDNEIKNHWNTHLKKRLTKMGVDPVTHKRKSNAIGPIPAKDAANISHLAQWETTRLEAERRLAPKSSKLNHFDIHPQVGPSAAARPLNKTTALRPAAPLQLVVAPCLDVLRASKEWIKPNGFFSPRGSLTSPTSTLHFSDDILGFPSAGFGAISPTFPEINCFGNSNEVGVAEEHIQRTKLVVEETKVYETFHPHDFPLQPFVVVDENTAGSLEFPSSMETLAGLSWPSSGQQLINQAGPCDQRSPCGNDLEDNEKHYWNHVLNPVTFTSGSPLF